MKRAALVAVLGLLAVVVVGGAIWLMAGIGVVSDHLDEARINKARLDLLTIEQAIVQYRIANGGDWPKSLDALAGGGPPLIERERLLDPSGRAYQFKTEGSGERERAVVWSQGPTPSDARGHIYSPRGRP